MLFLHTTERSVGGAVANAIKKAPTLGRKVGAVGWHTGGRAVPTRE